MYGSIALDAVGGCLQTLSKEYGLALSLFLAGLLGSPSHCAGMCGPIVIAQTGRMERLSGSALLPYHLGRISTYVLLAVIFGYVLNLAFLFMPVRQLLLAPILLTAGVIFLVNAFPHIRVYFPWVASLKLGVPDGWITKGLVRLTADKGAKKYFMTGAVLGLMPCGLVLAAIMAASTAPSILQGAFAMASFGAGTVPALVLISMGGQALKMKFPGMTRLMMRGALTLSAVWLFLLAGMMLI